MRVRLILTASWIKENALRALLAAVGTRGEAQPALALALELRRLAHAVRLCISLAV